MAASTSPFRIPSMCATISRVILLVCGTAACASAQDALPTTGAFMAGKPESISVFRDTMARSEHAFVLRAVPTGGSNVAKLLELLERRPASPPDREIEGTAFMHLREVTLAALQVPRPYPLWSLTSAYAFVGNGPLIILAICDPCNVAVLARKGQRVGLIEFSPQFPADTILRVLQTLDSGQSNRRN